MGTEQRGKCILIAEDDKSIRDLFEMVFLDEGYGVVACENGGDAENEIRNRGRHYFCLGLINLYMPVMCGDEVSRVIRRKSPETIIVLTSAASDSAAINKLLEEEVIDGYLPKPCDINELSNLLKCSREEVRAGKFRSPSSPSG